MSVEMKLARVHAYAHAHDGKFSLSTWGREWVALWQTGDGEELRAAGATPGAALANLEAAMLARLDREVMR